MLRFHVPLIEPDATEARFLGAEFTLSNVEGLLGMTGYPRDAHPARIGGRAL